MINSWFAYDVKRRAHKLLHGSMKEHCCKVRRYIEVLKTSNDESTFILAIDPTITKEILVFQRLFVCFEGQSKIYY